jgi:hypothetical protein
VAEHSRLEPLVKWLHSWPGAYRIRYKWKLQSESDLRERTGITDPKAPVISVFVADLLRFTQNDEHYSAKDREWLQSYLQEHYKQQFQAKNYSFQEFFDAFELEGNLNFWAVMSYGKPDALENFRKYVPGFSTGLYEQFMGEIAYFNH